MNIAEAIYTVVGEMGIDPSLVEPTFEHFDRDRRKALGNGPLDLLSRSTLTLPPLSWSKDNST